MEIVRSDVGSTNYGACSLMKGTELKEYNSEGSIWFKPVPSYKSNNYDSWLGYLNTKTALLTMHYFILYYTEVAEVNRN